MGSSVAFAEEKSRVRHAFQKKTSFAAVYRSASRFSRFTQMRVQRRAPLYSRGFFGGLLARGVPPSRWTEALAGDVHAVVEQPVVPHALQAEVLDGLREVRAPILAQRQRGVARAEGPLPVVRERPGYAADVHFQAVCGPPRPSQGARHASPKGREDRRGDAPPAAEPWPRRCAVRGDEGGGGSPGSQPSRPNTDLHVRAAKQGTLSGLEKHAPRSRPNTRLAFRGSLRLLMRASNEKRRQAANSTPSRKRRPQIMNSVLVSRCEG
jgi:hypothetical protein